MSFELIVTFGLAVGLSVDSNTPMTDVREVARQLDVAVASGWKNDAFITPAPVCDDATFLRRIWLDLAGRVPSYADADKLAQSQGRMDRQAEITRLLAAPEFHSYWGRMWAEYLLGQRPFDTAEFSGRKLQKYFRDALMKGRHYDEMVFDLITAVGQMDEVDAVNFLLRYNAEPNAVAGAVSQKFLGLSLQCAECHDHPHSTWKQTDFWGLSAFFARLRRMTPTNPQPNEQFAALIERPRGELQVVDKKAKPDEQGNFPTRIVIPQFPGAARRLATDNRRNILAAWITDPDNPYFARHCVNLIWRRLIGAKLVNSLDPVGDGSRKSQTATSVALDHTPVIEVLARDFIASDYNLQRLISVIVLSDTYQRGGQLPKSATDKPVTITPNMVLYGDEPARFRRAQDLFAVSRARPLSADQIHLCFGQAFGYYHDDNDHRLAQLTQEDFTYDIPIASFGEESQSLGRSLALFNGEHARGAVDVAAQSLLRIHGDAAGPAHVRHLFLSLLSRSPTEDEMDTFLDLTGAEAGQRGLEDAVWVIMNSAEFLTNH